MVTTGELLNVPPLVGQLPVDVVEKAVTGYVVLIEGEGVLTVTGIEIV
jgi:hypothetical protein